MPDNFNLSSTDAIEPRRAIVKKIINRFAKDESGATAIEYGLIAAMMAVALIAIFGSLTTKLSTAFNNIGTALTSAAPR